MLVGDWYSLVETTAAETIFEEAAIILEVQGEAVEDIREEAVTMVEAVVVAAVEEEEITMPLKGTIKLLLMDQQ
jgi:hypothetical protein